LTAKISALASEGRLSFYEQLCAELPIPQQTLLKVPGLGPTIAARIHRDLGEADADSLRRAAATGALQRVWGIGPKRTAAILDTLVGQQVYQERMEI
jgi:DNA polymerase (family 10)